MKILRIQDIAETQRWDGGGVVDVLDICTDKIIAISTVKKTSPVQLESGKYSSDYPEAEYFEIVLFLEGSRSVTLCAKEAHSMEYILYKADHLYVYGIKIN